MADFIPDKLPGRASRGEERTFQILKRLPDDYTVYYEPNIDNRRPDFVVIAPDLGVIIIEVKGWHISDILRGTDSEIIINDDGREKSEIHPLLQARNYQWRLVNLAKKHPKFNELLQKEGPHKNHFIFPFAHFVILPNISNENIRNDNKLNFSTLFPPKNTMIRDNLIHLESEDPGTIRDVLKSYFDPIWEFPPLTPEQIDIIRAIVHPEIILSYLKKEDTPVRDQTNQNSSSNIQKSHDLKVLDKRQEINAKKIGEGHRIVCGIAGSGKTVLLISRAKWLCERNPNSNILLLCYNVVFATYLKNQLKEFNQIKTFHFDEWAKQNGVTRLSEDPFTLTVEKDESLGQRLLTQLMQRLGDYRKYDAVLIDEAQDFSPTWFKCALESMKDPLDGDLLIVCDGNQGIRPINSISWKSLGIRAAGRTIHNKLDLDKNYRNTYEILNLASNFVNTEKLQNEDTFSIVPVNPDTATRRGPKPILIHCKDHQDECSKILQISKTLLTGFSINGGQPVSLRPEEIGVLYGGLFRKEKYIFEEFMLNFNKISPVVWLNADQFSRKRIGDPGLKIQTIHSAKGLQYKAVFVMWLDSFIPHNPDDENLKRRLLYVAMTRAEDYLIMTFTQSNEFVDRMMTSDSVQLIESDKFDPRNIFE